MVDRYLTVSEVAKLVSVPEEDVLPMAAQGALPEAITIDGGAYFQAEDIDRLLEEEDEAIPNAGVHLAVGDDSAYYRVIKASHTVWCNGWPFAVFALWDKSVHIRPWLTHVVDDLPGHACILLSCQHIAPVVRFEDLPKPTSIVSGYAWVGQRLEAEDFTNSSGTWGSNSSH